MSDWEFQKEALAEDMRLAGVVVDAQPHDHGVYVWTTKEGFGFGYYPDEVDDPHDPDHPVTGNIRAFYDFRVMDCFTMDTITEDHRHYRDDAEIFLNLCFDEFLCEREEVDAPSATTVFNMRNHDHD